MDNKKLLLSKINNLILKISSKSKFQDKWLGEIEAVVKSFNEELYIDFKKEAYIATEEEKIFKDFPPRITMQGSVSSFDFVGGRKEIDNTIKVTKKNIEPRVDVIKKYLHNIKEEIEFELRFSQVINYKNIAKSKVFIINENQIKSIKDKKTKALITELKFCYFANLYNSTGVLIRAILERVLNQLSPDIKQENNLKNKIDFTINNYKSLNFCSNDKDILNDFNNQRWIGNYVLHSDLLLSESNIEGTLKTFCIFLLSKINTL